jgi:hypothetical protein
LPKLHRLSGSFLVSHIVQFKVSDSAQLCLRELLERNKKGRLNEDKMAELDSYEQLDQLMQGLKAQAYLTIQ